jgi:hypothetical protein
MLAKKKSKKKLSAEEREDLKAAHAALREVKRTGMIPFSQIKKKLALP